MQAQSTYYEFSSVGKLQKALKTIRYDKTKIDNRMNYLNCQSRKIREEEISLHGYSFFKKQDQMIKMATCIETNFTVIYAFVSIMFHSEMKMKVSLTEIQKMTGSSSSYSNLLETKDEICSIKFATYEQPMDEDNQKIVLLIGTDLGTLKMIHFDSWEIHHKSIRLETQKLIDIQLSKEPDREYCLVLGQFFQIYAVNLRNGIVFAHFQYNYARVDCSFQLSVNTAGDHFLDATKEGSFSVWNINSQFRLAYDQSLLSSFKASRKYFSISPCSKIRTPAIGGLQFIQMSENKVYLITRQGTFKILALSTGHREYFIELVRFQIENGRNINCVNYDPSSQMVLFSRKGDNVIERIHVNLTVDSISVDKVTKYCLKYKQGKFGHGNMIIDSWIMSADLKIIMVFNTTMFFLFYNRKGFDQLEVIEEKMENVEYANQY